MTDRNYLKQLRKPTPDQPLRVLISACLTGIACGYDGSAYGSYPSVLKLRSYPNIQLIRFCPEEFYFGTPREICDIHGGNGSDVLDGKARVLSATAKDWTQGMIGASLKMLEIARREKIELAILMDISAACGSQVIYKGNRSGPEKNYQIGAGVCTAQLQRNGFKVISQRDFASLEILYAKIEDSHTIDYTKPDHHKTDWYKNYFGLKA